MNSIREHLANHHATLDMVESLVLDALNQARTAPRSDAGRIRWELMQAIDHLVGNRMAMERIIHGSVRYIVDDVWTPVACDTEEDAEKVARLFHIRDQFYWLVENAEDVHSGNIGLVYHPPSPRHIHQATPSDATSLDLYYAADIFPTWAMTHGEKYFHSLMVKEQRHLNRYWRENYAHKYIKCHHAKVTGFQQMDTLATFIKNTKRVNAMVAKHEARMAVLKEKATARRPSWTRVATSTEQIL